MTAATENRNTPRKRDDLVQDPVAANTMIYAGTMYALSATGFAVPAGTPGAGRVRAVARIGIAAVTEGEDAVDGERGVFCFANSADSDAITRADIGGIAYAADDQTVAKTDGGSTRPVAGQIEDVDSWGVWVLIAPGAVGPQGAPGPQGEPGTPG